MRHEATTTPRQKAWQMMRLTLLAAALVVGMFGAAFAQSTDIAISTLPVADSALAQVAMDQGFFANHGLNVKFNTVTIGSATTTAIVAGAAQFSQSNYATLIQARKNGLPVVVVAEAARAAKGFTGVYVMPDSSIQSPKDLAGKRIGTAIIGGIGPVLINEWLKSNGIDYKSIQWVQMPFGNMGAALQQHQIDAAWLVEPFTTKFKSELSAREVFDISSGVTAGVPFAGWAANENWAKDHPDIVKAFQTAIQEAGAYAEAHPDAIRKAIAEYTPLKEADVANLSLETYPATTDPQEIARVAQYMKDTGVLDSAFQVDSMILPQAGGM